MLALLSTSALGQPMTAGELAWPKHRIPGEDTNVPPPIVLLNASLDVYSDTNGTVAIVNDPVVEWRSQVGTLIMRQEDTSIAPIYAPGSGPGGQDVIIFTFPGVPLWMTNLAGFSASQPLTVVTVYQPSSGTASNCVLVSSTNGGTAFSLTVPRTATEDQTATAAAGTTLTATYTNDVQCVILAAVFNGASSLIRTNGVPLATGSAGNNGIQGLLIGEYEGVVLNIRIYDKALSSNQLNHVESELRIEYGL